jgi:gliding motility-associated-like protein
MKHLLTQTLYYRAFFALFCALNPFHSLFAQPSNDNCAGTIPLQVGSPLCTGVAAYTNAGATPSGYGAATCWGNASNDVWFSFTALATDINVTIIGNQPPAAGGTLNNPQVALYLGSCTGTINQLACGSHNAGNNVANMYKGGLIIGQTYLLRVQGENGSTGTFQICLNNYNAPAQAGSDCPQAAVLCDKSPFNVASVTGAGNDNDEAAGTCLGGLGTSSESNSTWFKWTCDQAGTLSMTLTPNSIADDLDFVVYELNGLNDCGSRQELRCMAAGDFNFPSPCMGPTGLRLGATDNTESSGCGGNKDNFVAAINMVAGRSYALVVNNFSASGSGFGVEWGGSGTFKGPNADFSVSPPRFCAGDNVNLQDLSTSSFGNINNWFWSFGVAANPSSSNQRNPSAVQFTQAGIKAITLTIQTDAGCVVTKTKYAVADSCCQTVNAINYTPAINDAICRGASTGSILINNPSSRLPLTYNWSNGRVTQNNQNIAGGGYQLTVSNGICNRIDSFVVSQPIAWSINDTIVRPTCAGGRDGAISITSVSGSNGGAYSYNWNNQGFINNPFLSNLPNGTYSLVVRDRLNCDTTVQFNVRELVLEIDSLLAIIQNPACFSDANGRIDAIVSNGLAPYTYQWANGATTRQISGLTAGVYTLNNITDANQCRGGAFSFTLTEPTLLTVATDSQEVSCFGDANGWILARAAGGTPLYTYLWNNLVVDSAQFNLPPSFYRVLVTDANGCTATNTATIAEPAQLFVTNLSYTAPTCYGYFDATVTVQAAGGRPDADGYEYSFNQTFKYTNNNEFQGKGAGVYTIYVRDSAGCVVSAPITVNEPAPFWVEIGADKFIELGDTFNLRADLSYIDFYNYNWSSSSNMQFGCDSCRATSVSPFENGSIYLQIQNQDGCLAFDSLKVVVRKNYSVFIPNAFTPNNDGINDIFRVFGNKTVRQVRQMQVFDRWGELVYSRNNIPIERDNIGWDGTFRGKEMEAGVFMYLVEVEYLDGELAQFKGDVTLLKLPNW